MRRIKRNNPAEESAIQRGIAADADAVEWTEQDFSKLCRAEDVLPASMLTALISQREALRKAAKGEWRRLHKQPGGGCHRQNDEPCSLMRSPGGSGIIPP